MGDRRLTMVTFLRLSQPVTSEGYQSKQKRPESQQRYQEENDLMVPRHVTRGWPRLHIPMPVRGLGRLRAPSLRRSRARL